MKRELSSLCVSIIFFLSQSCIDSKSHQSSISSDINKPNVIYILADDLGYGDLGCYGQQKISTPNIDRLANDGMLFTQHYAGSTVCSPSRSSLLTGQHTGHTPIRGNKKIKGKGNFPLPRGTKTIGHILKEQGYVTGAFGKWGLGYPGSDGAPLKQGFDYFYGYNNQTLAHNHYPYHLWVDNQKIMLKGNKGSSKEQYAPTLIQQRALSFIDQNKDRPFFLFYATTLPHAELAAPKSYMEKYKGKLLPEKPYKGIDGGLKYRQGDYGSQEHPHAAFAAMISLLDHQVGEIMDKVKSLGLENNTIIIFTSDNGPHKEGGGDPDYFNSNGIYRGYKRDLYEGGIRVPMIVKWKNKIKKRAITNHISAFWDLMPTLTDLVSAKTTDGLDGISFLPTLLGNGKQKEHEYLYWEFHENGGRQAIRKGDWKLVIYNLDKGGQNGLFNLKEDPGEINNLAKIFPEMVEELLFIIKKSRTESKDFNFNYPIN
jgi:arylsulfatase A-like enzyme